MYRARIGIYSPRKSAKKCIGNRLYTAINSQATITDCLVFILYLIYIIYFAAISMGIILSMDGTGNLNFDYIRPLSYAFGHSSTALINTKNFYLILISFIIRRYILFFSSTPFWKLPLVLTTKTFSKSALKNSKSRQSYEQLHCRQFLDFLYKFARYIYQLTHAISYWLLLLNFLLIAMINPGLLNPGPGNTLSVAYQNVQGLVPFGQLNEENPTLDVNKMIELNLFVNEHKPDILVLNETWLKTSILDSEILSSDYKIFRLDRSRQTHPLCPTNPRKYRQFGGGVLIAVRSDIEVVSKLVNLKCNAEILGVELVLGDGKKVIICSSYRVGTLGSLNHSYIDKYLKTIKRKRKINSIYLVGDMNLAQTSWDILTSPDPVEQSFVNTFCELGLEQLIKHPTHSKGNTLDLVLSTETHKVINLTVFNDLSLSLCKSDHYLITFDIKYKARRKKSVKRTIYNFKRADWDSLNRDLRRTNWDSLLGNSDVDSAWINFKSHLKMLSDTHIPKIKIKSEFQPPWFDSEVYQLCREKERFRSRYKRTKSEIHYVKFADCRRRLKHLVAEKMNDNFVDGEDTELINKKFWTYVKSNSNCHRIPEVVTLKDRSRKNSLDKAELFNDFFCDQFSDPSTYSIDIDFENDNAFNIDFSINRIKHHLYKINPNKAQGPDEIHGRILKHCATSLAYPLSILFKISYNSGYIPSDWKLAHVVPIHKKGSKSNAENYRPISLTSLVMKTFEKVIRDELMLRCKEFLDTRQHGFLPQKSCCTQMIEYCDSLSLSLNQNLRADIIYLDFSKAFDSVNHDIILSKLKYQYKIDGALLKFIANYLKGRKQRVVVGNEMSSIKDVLSGVPQGSIIGPLLFVLFINDITACLSTGTNIAIYADDTKIWRTVSTNEDHLILQNDLRMLHDWAISNKMKFNTDKCKVLSVTHLRQPLLGILPEIQFMYEMNGDILDYCTSEKDLGININSKLNWNDHCTYLVSKANQKFGLLRRTCHFVKNTRRKRALYLVLIRSIFEHCPVVWRPNSKLAIDKLENVQKRAIKWILNDYSSYTYDMYLLKCKSLDILPITARFDLHDLNFFHSVFYKFSPVQLPWYLKPFESSRLRSCHLDNLCLISSVTPKLSISKCYPSDNEQGPRNFENSFFYRTHLAWNRLPHELRQIQLSMKFKEEITKLLWKNLITNHDESLPD